MRTAFRAEQLSDPRLRAAEASLRSCVHCGFCTATCPTYVLLGDERDSPRGRIALIQNMLETGATPSAEAVRHVDRCLSCLGCRTTCPSSVDYAVLVDAARVHIENTYTRPLWERLYRALVLFTLTRPAVFAAMLTLARGLGPLARRLPGRIGILARKVPPARKVSRDQYSSVQISTPPKRRITLLPGCVQRALAPEIDMASARVLARQGDEATSLPCAGCCGALAFHMGREDEARSQARTLMTVVEAGGAGADAVLMTASGCVAFLKDYPRLFLGTSEEPRARAFAMKVRDFSELLDSNLAPPAPAHTRAWRVAYHPPCSLQHGQRVSGVVEEALLAAGFKLAPFAEQHLCCGSAGSYSLLQPALSEALRARKVQALKASGANVAVTGNIGCLAQLSGADALPIVHLAELLDYAAGGILPAPLKGLARENDPR